MRAREFIRPVAEQQVNEFLPVLGAALATGARVAGTAAVKGAQAVGQGVKAVGQAVAPVAKQIGQGVANAATQGAKQIGQGISQGLNNVGQQQQPTPQDVQQAQKSQQDLGNDLAQLKGLGININPQQTQAAINKSTLGTPLNNQDKDNLAKMTPALGGVIADPKLLPQLKTLIQKGQQGA